jgi:hypothetical protein
LRPVDLPEVEFDQGHDGLVTDNNNIPVGQLADEFDGQHVLAGQLLPPWAGGIVLDEVLAPPPQEDPLNLSSPFSAHIGAGLLSTNEHERNDVKVWTEEFLRPAIDLYDTTVTRGVIEGTMKSWGTFMK